MPPYILYMLYILYILYILYVLYILYLLYLLKSLPGVLGELGGGRRRLTCELKSDPQSGRFARGSHCYGRCLLSFQCEWPTVSSRVTVKVTTVKYWWQLKGRGGEVVKSSKKCFRGCPASNTCIAPQSSLISHFKTGVQIALNSHKLGSTFKGLDRWLNSFTWVGCHLRVCKHNNSTAQVVNFNLMFHHPNQMLWGQK